jgi:Transglycosylase SLT domain
VPSVANPTFSFAVPGPAPLGVPNFFIDSFRIPPFLLPIYQAAGIQYDVPWQVLAAINEIETDYGRDLSVSSAGAVGWMQFLPSTWKSWGVDANGDGVADPYNPVDAIFTAARYLHAAGASRNLSQAIFAYNHAGWYVQSVLLRAQLIGGMPDKLIGALTGLVEGHFPVAAPSKYADSWVAVTRQRVKGANAAVPVSSDPSSQGVNVFARQGSPVIAVNDGRVLKVVRDDPRLGNYLELQDATGNVYTYANLGSIPAQYPVPKPVRLTARQLAQELSAPSSGSASPRVSSPATAGSQQSAPTTSATQATKALKGAPISLPVTPAPAQTANADSATVSAPLAKERLFADPHRPASYAAGGKLQIQNTQAQISSFQNYFSDVLHLAKNQYTLAPLKAGAVVVAGTILGRLAAPTPKLASHLLFMIRPAGAGAPQIDPKPILDGWKLLEATAVYRAAGVDPFYGPGSKNATIGQILLESKTQLTNRVLEDPHIAIYACGRRDIQAGLIDRRILADIEFLSASSLYPTISGLDCGHSATGANGIDPAGATGNSMDISAVNHIPVAGHQQPGSITDITIRRLLTLQGIYKPDQIISTISYKGQPTTLALPDHKNRIQVTYTPNYGPNNKLSTQIKSILQPGQWIQLINRISQIPEPVVPIAPSKYAIQPGHR